MRPDGYGPVGPCTLHALVRKWARLWGVPDLPDHVTISFSPRMRKSLGRCRPASGRIRLAGHLEDGPREILEEVLCHEVAHVAAHRLRGRGARPHGPEWAELVRLAGFEPRTRAPSATAGATNTTIWPADVAPEGPAPRFEHRCPVCHTSRIARRPVPSWHCAECLDAGLPGKMLISRVERPDDRDTRVVRPRDTNAPATGAQNSNDRRAPTSDADPTTPAPRSTDP